MDEKAIPVASGAFDKLRQKVLAKVEEQRGVPPQPPSRSAKLLGRILEGYLINTNHLRQDLAQELNADEEFVDALIEGMIPESEIGDGLLEDLARAIGYEPNLLFILLGRELAKDGMWETAQQRAALTRIDRPTATSTRRGYYLCSVEGCTGHDTFSANCLEVGGLPFENQAHTDVHRLQHILHQIEQQQHDIHHSHHYLQDVLKVMREELNRLYDNASNTSTLRELDILNESYQRAAYSNELQTMVSNTVQPSDMDDTEEFRRLIEWASRSIHYNE